MSPMFWSIVCLLLMLCLIGVELLTPSMGGFTLAALLFSAGSVFAGFRDSEATGWVMLAVNALLFPGALFVGFQFLKRSPIVHKSESAGGVKSAPDGLALEKLNGEVGKALTPLRPGGAVLINGRKVDVVSEGKFVDAGTVVRVIRVTGTSVIVEPVA